TEPTETVSAPVAIHGRVAKVGGSNEWKVELKKGVKYTLDLQARRYEAAVCGGVAISGAAGQGLARAEAAETPDPKPRAFPPPADGTYTLRVSEKFRGRGGPNFVYRLRITDGTESAEPGFRLTLPSDVFTVQRGGAVKVKVTAERRGFGGPIQVSV